MNRVTMNVIFYNHEKFVQEALEACFNQDYNSYDLVIRDDCSSDDTPKEILKYLSRNEFTKGKLIVDLDTRNRGLIESHNRVLELSEGDVIVHQGGDDISMRHRISRSLEIMDRYSVDLVSADGIIIDSDSSVIGDTWYRKYVKEPFKEFGHSPEENCVVIKKPDKITAYSVSFAGFGIAYKKRILGSACRFPNNLVVEDVYLTFLANVNNGSAVILEPLVYYRRHNKNVYKNRFDNFEEFLRWQLHWTKGALNILSAEREYFTQFSARKELKNASEIEEHLHLHAIKRNQCFNNCWR
ncbi:MAG TPA: glycosyltransferase [Enterococcus sp.]|nr:glycosyltransferase [Enterococcus sp.]